VITRRRVLLTAPALLGAAGPAPGQQATQVGIPPAARPVSRMDTPWWKARHEAVLRRLKQGPCDLLLIGDSITMDLERRGPIPEMDFGAVWERFHAPRKAVNLGFKGDSTAHLLWRLRNGELDGGRPKAVQLLIGANNFGRVRWDAADTMAGIDAVLSEIQRKLPRVPVLLVGVLPSKRSDWVDTQTVALNRMLAARFPAGRDVDFIDAGAIFHRNGALDPDAFYDGKLRPPEPWLHPSASAWLRMAELIEPRLSARMGDARR